MEIVGTVTKVVHRRSSAGNRYLSVTLRRDDGSTGRLTYLQTFAPEPVKGHRVKFTGIPMMCAPKRGTITTNIGAVRVEVMQGAPS